MNIKYLNSFLFFLLVAHTKLRLFTLAFTTSQAFSNLVVESGREKLDGEKVAVASIEDELHGKKNKNFQEKQLEVLVQKSLKHGNQEKNRIAKKPNKDGESLKAKREVGSLIDDLDYPSEYEDSNAEKLQNTELLKNNDDNENNMNIKLYTENNEKIIENTLESHKDEESFMPPNLATTPSVERNNNKDDDAIFPDSSKVFDKDSEKMGYNAGDGGEMLSAIPVQGSLSPANAEILKNFPNKEKVFENETQTAYEPKDYIIDDFETFINKNSVYDVDLSGFLDKEYDVYMGEEKKDHFNDFNINQTTEAIEFGGNTNSSKSISSLTPNRHMAESTQTILQNTEKKTVDQNKYGKKKEKMLVDQNRKVKKNKKMKKKKIRNDKFKFQEYIENFPDQTSDGGIMKKIDILNEQTEDQIKNDYLINEIFNVKMNKKKKLCYTFKRILLKAEMFFRNCRTLVLGYGNITWNELINVDWMKKIGVKMSYEVVKYTKALNPGLRMFLIVRDQWGNSTSFNKMLESHRNRISFAHSAMKLLRNVGYDGIEMRFDRPDYYYSQVFNLVKDMNLVFEKHDLFLRYKVPYHVTHPSLKIGLSVPSYMLNLVDIASIKNSLDYLVLLNKEEKLEYLNKIKTKKTQEIIKFVRTGFKPTSIQIETTSETTCRMPLTENRVQAAEKKRSKRALIDEESETGEYAEKEGGSERLHVFNTNLLRLLSRVLGKCDSWYVTFRGSSEEEFKDLINFIIASSHKKYDKEQDTKPKAGKKAGASFVDRES